jgi:G3E family GTPase
MKRIIKVLTDQIEFANVIILNKSDLVEPRELKLLEGIIRKLNPDAKLIKTSFSHVEPKAILHTNLFDYEKAQQSAGWIKELSREHTPETEEYGINSFVFRDPRPFNAERLWTFIKHEWPQAVIRSKGIFWMASRPEEAILWSQAGGSMKAEMYGKWWASVPENRRLRSVQFHENKAILEKKWDTKWGDRLNEIVLIGQNMNQARLETQLRECLCNESEETYLVNGGKFSDTWPL